MAVRAVVLLVVSLLIVSAFNGPQGVRRRHWSMKRSWEEVTSPPKGTRGTTSFRLAAVNELAEKKKKAISESSVFTEDEVDSVVKGIKNILGTEPALNEGGIRSVVRHFAHTTHKNWENTERESIELEKVLPAVDTEEFKRLLFRVLEGGNWERATIESRSKGSDSTQKPWAVLITGLNGIRKSTSVYQEWFQDCLHDSLVKDGFKDEKTDLPKGQNTFFRQLDYIVATLANEDFRQLYDIPSENVDAYATLKDAIFGRYRKLAEMVGILLIRMARTSGVNVMVETSGRDVAMYRYIDHCFPADEYRKLVVHFTINDIEFACDSVDRRMTGEIAAGASALASLRASSGGTDGDDDGDFNSVPSAVRALIEANAGGPYGSAVLPGVEKASNEVWETVKDGSAGVGAGWHKAGIEILAHKDKDWEARSAGGESRYVFKRQL